MSGRYLVTGGAGFVGSHLVLALLRGGASVTVLDDLTTGHEAAVPKGASLVRGSVADPAVLERAFAEGPYEAVFHFASLTLVGESMREPVRYMAENFAGAAALVQGCVTHGVNRIVVSSTANLFAEPERMPIDEDEAVIPGSPYGESKAMLERLLYWADRIHGLRGACLRYFNAAGADPEGEAGEDHRPETHLIPLVLDAAAGRRDPLTVFGDDYATPDGTCIRDYIHVADLATAHLAVLEPLRERSVRFNLGTGKGHSVREVIAAAEKVTGLAVPYTIGQRREGDPAVLVAASRRIVDELGWRPRYPDLATIVDHAWAWRQAHPKGYG